ncbi:MAG: DUF4382 domain-containing protein [Candidatus Micrarchaeia archaeon]
MGKFGETKSKIVDLLNQRNMTLSEISERLNLAPSTVSQHLQELEQSGKIKKSDEQHSRKWQYYELDRRDSERGLSIAASQRGRASIFAAVAIFATFIIAYVLSSYMPVEPMLLQMSPNMAVPAGATVFTISDSPMQYNISAVYVKLNSIAIHSQTTGKWYTIPSYATFNLVELRNISKVIAGADIPYGIYNEVVLNVSNAEATINGVNESVFLPSGRFRIFDDFNISGNSTNIINFDFNLERSIHVTGNGRIVMMPVVTLGCGGNNTLNVRGDFIMGFGHFKTFHTEVFGMSANGTMQRNASAPYNIEINGNRILESSNNSIPNIIVDCPHAIFIESNPGLKVSNQGNINITVGALGRNITCSIEDEHILICRTSYNWSSKDMLNVTKQINRSISALNNFTNVNGYSNGTQIYNSGYEIMRIGYIDPNASIGMFSCDTSSQCALVPTTFCQNNLPGQEACINIAYVPEYMQLYQSIRDHKPIMCPMFIVAGSSSCSCVNNSCALVYNKYFTKP